MLLSWSLWFSSCFHFCQDCHWSPLNLSNKMISRYGPMGIGYAPNKELYTEHFLKPLRSAFSERDLQVIIEPAIILRMITMIKWGQCVHTGWHGHLWGVLLWCFGLDSRPSYRWSMITDHIYDHHIINILLQQHISENIKLLWFNMFYIQEHGWVRRPLKLT